MSYASGVGAMTDHQAVILLTLFVFFVACIGGLIVVLFNQITVIRTDRRRRRELKKLRTSLARNRRDGRSHLNGFNHDIGRTAHRPQNPNYPSEAPPGPDWREFVAGSLDSPAGRPRPLQGPLAPRNPRDPRW